MTKREMAQEMAERTGLQFQDCVKAVQSYNKIVVDTLQSGENIYIRGFGTWEVTKRKQKTARNISKGETIIVPACKVARFRPCKDFKNGL